MSTFSLVPLSEIKRVLNKDSTITSDDTLYEQIGRQASNIIENALNRKIRRRTFTEYHKGKGTGKLWIKNPPINSITSIYLDNGFPREWQSDDLLDTNDYEYHDDDTGLIIYDSMFDKPSNGLANIKITYVGGFEEFVIEEDYNDTIEWNDGTNRSCTVAAGTYTGTELATAAQTAMNAVVSSPAKTVVYNRQTGKFKFTQDSGVFIIKFFNGSYPEKSIGDVMGFDRTTNKANVAHNRWGDFKAISGNLDLANGWEKQTFDSMSGVIVIRNLDMSQEIEVSFNESDILTTIPPRFSPPDIESMADCIYLRSKAASGVDVPYDLLYSVNSGTYSWESDIGSFGIPEAIDNAAKQLIQLLYGISPHGKLDYVGIKSITAPGGAGTLSVDKEEQENILKQIMPEYRKSGIFK